MHISNGLNWFWLDLLCGVVSYLICSTFTIVERMFSSKQQRNWNKTRTLHGNNHCSMAHGNFIFFFLCPLILYTYMYIYEISWPNKFIDSSNCICIKSQASETQNAKKSQNLIFMLDERNEKVSEFSTETLPMVETMIKGSIFFLFCSSGLVIIAAFESIFPE